MSTELVDVELVVGEQYEVLKVAWAGGRVVRQAMQRIVDALCSELRQRPRPAHRRFVCAVGDLIVGSVKIWNVEQVSDRPLDVLGRGAVDVGTFEKSKMQWDGRFRFRYNDRNAMVAHDQTKLLDEIGFEQVGLASRESGEGIAQEPGISGIECSQSRDCLACVVEALPHERLWCSH